MILRQIVIVFLQSDLNQTSEEVVFSDKPNIVQAEFFHIRFTSLDDIFEECPKRNMEGSPTKSAIRFFDTDGLVTEFMLDWEESDERYEQLLASPRSANAFSRLYKNFCFRMAARKMDRLKKAQVSLVIHCLKKLIRVPYQIGIECMDYSFRPVQPNEIHELLERIRSSPKALLFLMEPNDLFSGRQKVCMDTL